MPDTFQVLPSPTFSLSELPDDNPFLEGPSGQAVGCSDTPCPESGQAALKQKIYHPFLNGKSFFGSLYCALIYLLYLFIGHPCDKNGHYPPTGTPPLPCPTATSGDWTPFEDEVQFKVADFLYHQEEMSQGNINSLLELWTL